MTFRHFENAMEGISDDHISKYLEVFGKLQEPTKTVLGYTLDIASCLNLAELSKDYAVFGGYAVLSHLMREHGEDIAVSWRGSTDIDMIGTERVRAELKKAYDVRTDMVSFNLPDKRTLNVVEDYEKECKIDFDEGNPKKRFPEIERNTHFGVDLMVASPLYLVKGKLCTPKEDQVHSVDILRMLSVLERRGYDPGDITRFFKAEERDELIKRIIDGKKISEAYRSDLVPKEEFLSELERELHRGRSVRGSNRLNFQ